MGLGYIGLPTAAMLASRGVDVLGVDVKPDVVDIVNQGKIHIIEPDLDMLVRAAANMKKLRASLTPEEAEQLLEDGPELIPDAVIGIYEFWVEQREKAPAEQSSGAKNLNSKPRGKGGKPPRSN